MGDGIALELRGIPAVSVVTEDFMSEARSLIRLSKLKNFQVAEIPHPLASIPPDKLGEHARIAFERLQQLIAQPVPAKPVEA